MFYYNARKTKLLLPSENNISHFSMPGHSVVRSLFSRCSVVVQSNTEQRLNNGRENVEQQHEEKNGGIQ